MSIKPVDYSTMFTKTQEVSKIKQVEFDRTKVQTEQGVIQQDNKIKKDKQRITHTNKSENTKINVKDNKKEKRNKKDKRKNNKGYNHRSEGEQNKKDKGVSKRKDDLTISVGGNVDIKI